MLTINLVEAWQHRAEEAKKDLKLAGQAPGLFSREFIERRTRDYQYAMVRARQWFRSV